MRLKNNKYSMDKKAADETLKNVFAACDQNPNETPLEVIRAISIANAAVVRIGLISSIIVLAIVLLTPLAFIPKDRLSVGNAKIHEVKVTGHYMDNENECFVMCLSGEGILYDEIYALDNNGVTIKPLKYDEGSCMVWIPFEKGNINIYVPNENGTTLQAVLSK